MAHYVQKKRVEIKKSVGKSKILCGAGKCYGANARANYKVLK